MSAGRSLLGVLALLSLFSLVHPVYGLAWVAAVVVIGGAVFKVKGRTLTEWFVALDDTIYRGEQIIVAIALLVMAFGVFLDVVWRTAHSIESHVAIGFTIAFLVMCIAGGLTARWEGAGPVKRIVAGVFAFGVLMGFILAVKSADNGFGWSQELALVLLLWVGLLGGSMATREGRHIAVDAVRRILPEKLVRPFEIVSGLVTVSLCLFLTALALEYVHGNYIDWRESGGRAFLFESLSIPYFVATLPIVIGFGMTALRFLQVIFHGATEVDVLASHGLEVE